MDAPLQDERISAFLDGELPPDQRAEFERQMADSAELRQLVEELRAVRESLQALPRHRLEEDFAARILQRAERAMLTNQPPPGQAGVTPARESSPGGAAWPDSRPSRRPWIWAAVTIAAAVLLMVLNSAPKNAKVARVDNAPAKKDAVAKAPPSELAQDADRIAPAGAAAAAPGGSGGEGNIEHFESLAPPRNGISGRADGARSNSAAADKQPQPKEVGDGKFAAKQSDGENGRASGREAGQIAAGRSVTSAGPATPEAAKKKDESLASQMRMRAADMRPPLHGPPDEQIVVAEFTTARRMASAGVPELLAKRGITLVQGPSGGRAFGGKPGGSVLELAGSAPAASAQDPTAKSGPAAQGGLAKPPSPVQPSRAAEQVEVIYVEASRDQVRGLLEDLRSRPATFGFVAESATTESSTMRGQAAASPLPAVAGKGGIGGGGQSANRPAPQEGKSAEGQNAAEEKGRDLNFGGVVPAKRDATKSDAAKPDDGRRRQYSANRKRELAEPTAWATQIESVPPAAEELLQQEQQQPQRAKFANERRGPSQPGDKDLQDRTGSFGDVPPAEQAQGAGNAEPNQRAAQSGADRLQNAGPRAGENNANQRNSANQAANQAENRAAKSATGRGAPAADSAFSQFDSASALGEEAPDRVRAVLVFRLGPPAAASPVPAAPAAPASAPR